MARALPTLSEASDELGITACAVRDLIRDGALQAIFVYGTPRITRASIDTHISRQAQQYAAKLAIMLERPQRPALSADAYAIQLDADAEQLRDHPER